MIKKKYNRMFLQFAEVREALVGIHSEIEMTVRAEIVNTEQRRQHGWVDPATQDKITRLINFRDLMERELDRVSVHCEKCWPGMMEAWLEDDGESENTNS